MNFGFQLQRDNQIDYDRADRSVAERLAEQEPTFRTCIGCGTCAATCSAGQFTEFSFRRISNLVQRGLLVAARHEISRCMMCGKCLLACPRGVNTRHAIFLLKTALQAQQN